MMMMMMMMLKKGEGRSALLVEVAGWR